MTKELKLNEKTIPQLKEIQIEVDRILKEKIEAAKEEAIRMITEISQSSGLSVMIRSGRKKKGTATEAV